MKTDDWIDMLAHPAAQLEAQGKQAQYLWLGSGLLVAVALCAVFWGVDARWPLWLSTWPYAFKAGSALLVAALAAIAWRRLLSPTQEPLPVRSGLLMSWAVLVLVALAMPALDAPLRDIWQGTWRQCAPSIVLLAVPVWVALWQVSKQQAPVHLRTVGAAMGAVSGGVGAVVYSLHCSEFAPMFIAVWYGLGIAASVLLSVWLAPRALRW